jgi:hypothetical protein
MNMPRTVSTAIPATVPSNHNGIRSGIAIISPNREYNWKTVTLLLARELDPSIERSGLVLPLDGWVQNLERFHDDQPQISPIFEGIA